MAGEAWSDDEIAATIEGYFRMLRAELVGEPYVKAVEQRRLAAVGGRSAKSAGYKFSNVSAALNELGLVYVQGYKPLSNLQHALRDAVVEHVRANPEIMGLMDEFVDHAPHAPTDMQWETDPEVAPVIELGREFVDRQRLPRTVDYVEREARNRALGLAGERVVVDLERRRLAALGRPDLADRVEHVAQTVGDGLGFDVLSFGGDGDERYIEVKTTRRDKYSPFWLTRSEVDFSDAEPNRFELRRLYGFGSDDRSAGHYRLSGPLEESCLLDAASYTAVPRLASA